MKSRITIALLFGFSLVYAQESYTTRKNNKSFVAEYSISANRTKMTINGVIYEFREDKNVPINVVAGSIFKASLKQTINSKPQGVWCRIEIRFSPEIESVNIYKNGILVEKLDNDD